MLCAQLSRQAAEKHRQRQNCADADGMFLVHSGLMPHCPTAVHLKSFCTVQRLGKRSAPTTKDKTGREAIKKLVQSRWSQTNLPICDCDTVGLVSGFGFSRYVRGATDVDAFEWYAVLSGLSALLLHSCVVQASQGVSGQPSTKQSACVSLDSTFPTRISGRALHCCRKNVFNSMSRLARRNLTLDGADGCG